MPADQPAGQPVDHGDRAAPGQGADIVLPDWRTRPLDRFANIDNSTAGFTELRCHGVSGPLPGQVLQFPEQVVSLVDGNPDSGFWRRWRLGGPEQDVPDERHVEAFCWGGLTSRASLQALWLLLVPFSLGEPGALDRQAHRERDRPAGALRAQPGQHPRCGGAAPARPVGPARPPGPGRAADLRIAAAQAVSAELPRLLLPRRPRPDRR